MQHQHPEQLPITDKEFEGYIQEGILAIPPRFRAKLDNVAFLLRDIPDEEMRLKLKLTSEVSLFGLYQGIPLTKRGESYSGLILPDTITIFKNPIVSVSGGDRERVRKLVIDTVWHEVAHYFGYDDAQILIREQEGRNHSV